MTTAASGGLAKRENADDRTTGVRGTCARMFSIPPPRINRRNSTAELGGVVNKSG
jgi:hypothetical protein